MKKPRYILVLLVFSLLITLMPTTSNAANDFPPGITVRMSKDSVAVGDLISAYVSIYPYPGGQYEIRDARFIIYQQENGEHSSTTVFPVGNFSSINYFYPKFGYEGTFAFTVAYGADLRLEKYYSEDFTITGSPIETLDANWSMRDIVKIGQTITAQGSVSGLQQPVVQFGGFKLVDANGKSLAEGDLELQNNSMKYTPQVPGNLYFYLDVTDSLNHATRFFSPTAQVTDLDWWQDGNGQWYIYRNGSPAPGWHLYGKSWYYADAYGAMQTGWLQSGSEWYYLSNSGPMLTGWQSIGGTWYYFNQQGKMLTGWVQNSSYKWFYLNSSGAMQTGWQFLDGSWYYFNADGIMHTGWLQSGGQWYFLDSDGSMRTLWLRAGGRQYYMGTNGVMYTGWLREGNYLWYYFKSDGSMATSTTVIDGVVHSFGSSGVWFGEISQGW